MKEYEVTISETLERKVSVQAYSKEDAMEKVKSAYSNSEYVLGAEDFTGVNFTEPVEKEMASTIDVLLVKPGRYPERIQIGTDLEDYQQAVGGYIEVVYPFKEQAALVVAEEGKVNGFELNRALFDEAGNIYDIVAGDFLVVGLGYDDFTSLSPELMEKFEERFHHPETFLKMGKSIMVIPVSDESVKSKDDIKPMKHEKSCEER